MTILEAGLRAGAKYVREASYKKGVQRGWDAGWIDGWEAALKDIHATNTNSGACMQPSNEMHDRDDISNEHTQENSTDNNNHDNIEHDHTEQGEEEGACVLQLNDEWAQLFTQGMRKRRAGDRHGNDGANIDSNNYNGDDNQSDQEMNGSTVDDVAGRQQELGGLDLGGVRKRQRVDEIQRLYGMDKENGDNQTKRIAAIETRLDSRFQQVITQSSAVPWPFV